jgi:hypothetical protein
MPHKSARVHLGGGVFTYVNREYKCVIIRHYLRLEDTQTDIPTIRGITLNFAEWEQLCSLVEKINKTSVVLTYATAFNVIHSVTACTDCEQ